MNVLNVLKSADFLNSVKVMWQSMLAIFLVECPFLQSSNISCNGCNIHCCLLVYKVFKIIKLAAKKT